MLGHRCISNAYLLLTLGNIPKFVNCKGLWVILVLQLLRNAILWCPPLAYELVHLPSPHTEIISSILMGNVRLIHFHAEFDHEEWKTELLHLPAYVSICYQ